MAKRCATAQETERARTGETDALERLATSSGFFRACVPKVTKNAQELKFYIRFLVLDRMLVNRKR